MDSTKPRTYEQGVLDGMRIAAGMGLRELADQIMEFVEEYRRRRSVLAKLEYVIQRIKGMLTHLSNGQYHLAG